MKKHLQKKEKHKLTKEFHNSLDKTKKSHYFRTLFRFKYKKLTLLSGAIILAYYFFGQIKVLIPDQSNILVHYLSSLIAGIFLSFGPLAPFATAFFIAMDAENIFIIAVVSALGSLAADMIIFKFIRFSFLDEFQRIKKTEILHTINNSLNKGIFHKAKIYLLYSFIGIAIASPLPDEIGISMLAGLVKIKSSALMILSFVLHFIGMLIFLSI